MNIYRTESVTESELYVKASSMELSSNGSKNDITVDTSPIRPANFDHMKSETKSETYEVNSGVLLNDGQIQCLNTGTDNLLCAVIPTKSEIRNRGHMKLTATDTIIKEITASVNWSSNDSTLQSLTSLESSFMSTSFVSLPSIPYSLSVVPKDCLKQKCVDPALMPNISDHDYDYDVPVSDLPTLQEEISLLNDSKKMSLVSVFFLYRNYGLLTIKMWEDAVNNAKRFIENKSDTIYGQIKHLLSLINSSVLVIKLRMMQEFKKGNSTVGINDIISIDEMVEYLKDFPSIHYRNFYWSSVEKLWGLIKDSFADDFDGELMKLVTRFDKGNEEGYVQSFFMNKNSINVKIDTPKVIGKYLIKIESYNISGTTSHEHLMKSATVVIDNTHGYLQDLVNQLFLASVKKIISTQGARKI